VSIANEIKPAAPQRALRLGERFRANTAAWFRLLARSPRGLPAGVAWRAPLPVAIGTLASLCLIVAAMVLIDAPTIIAVRSWPHWIVAWFDWLTDFGTSDWFLVPIGLVLAAIAAIASPALTHTSRLVLAAMTVRLGFVFAAIALPGLVVTIGKRLIGRARPFVGGHADPFLYLPFSWTPDHASLPSGHATNVFAALVAIGLLWPRLRGVMLAYALIIAASRVIVLAHHPSDVLAGALAGSLGALLVRDYFAARRLGFAIGPDGVHALPGPSARRLFAVARQIVAQ
jgi:membrane-associated phospholipid phosphatase